MKKRPQPLILKVSKLHGERLHVEIPKKDRKEFQEGDNVVIEKVSEQIFSTNIALIQEIKRQIFDKEELKENNMSIHWNWSIITAIEIAKGNFKVRDKVILPSRQAKRSKDQE